MLPNTRLRVLFIVLLSALVSLCVVVGGSATIIPSDIVSIGYVRSDLTCCDHYTRDLETYVKETLPYEWPLMGADRETWKAGAVIIRSGVWWRVNRSKLGLLTHSENGNCYQGTDSSGFFYDELAPDNRGGVEHWTPGPHYTGTDPAVDATRFKHAEVMPPSPTRPTAYTMLPTIRPDNYIMFQYGPTIQGATLKYQGDYRGKIYYALEVNNGGSPYTLGTCRQIDKNISANELDIRGALDGPSALAQLRADGTTPIPLGGLTADHNPVFSGQVSDLEGRPVRLEIELRRLAEFGGTFQNTPTAWSDFVNSGSVAQIRSVANLISDSYHWQARTVNNNLLASRWVSLTGNSSDMDFFDGLACVGSAASGTPVSVLEPGDRGWSSSCSSGTGSIRVNANLDGASWSGQVRYTLNGPSSVSESSLGTFSGFQPGNYTLSNVSGGPPGAVFSGVTPPSSQLLSANGSITFTLNFTSQPPQPGSLTVNATLDGGSWSGPVTFQVSGPGGFTGGSLGSFNEPTGFYAVSYVSGGPPGASILGVNPPGAQYLSSGGSVTFTLVFQTSGTRPGFLIANATMDGVEWRGSAIFQIAGPGNPQSGAGFPFEILATPGTYTLTYITGGPPGAQLRDITPAPSQTVGSGSTITFIFNFITPIPGFIAVNGTLDGAVWNGNVAFQVSGIPGSVNEAGVPNLIPEPPGPWSVQYVSGGPPNATFIGVLPVASTQITAGFTSTFTLAFVSNESPPQVITGGTDQIGQTGAMLHMQVNPNGSTTTSVWFQYGLDTSYGSATPAQPVYNGTAFTGVSQPVSGLQCQMLYHYRAVASNSAATVYGDDANFTTAPCGQPSGTSFYTFTPCRILDTRPLGNPISANSGLRLQITGICGIPPTATAVALNVTAVGATSQGILSVYPEGSVPSNYTVAFGAGQTRAGSTVVGLSSIGTLMVFCYMPSGQGQTDYIIDVSGYFQ